jgi:hypothetical protein
MAHPLDGARLKVVRAKQHLESFNGDAERYINTKPCKVITRIEGDCICVEGVITTEPPAPLACIVGDFVTNLRAALDYIAWELANKFVGRPLSTREEEAISFPIVRPGKANFADLKSAKLLQATCCVPADAMSVIESVQPYNAGYDAIGALDLLVRRDKHRALLLCGTFVGDVGDISVYHGSKLAWKASGRSAVFGLSRMEMNLAAFSQPFKPAADYRVEMHGEPTVFISLKDFPSPGESTWVSRLQQILKCVANVIPRFEPFFP